MAALISSRKMHFFISIANENATLSCFFFAAKGTTKGSNEVKKEELIHRLKNFIFSPKAPI